MRLAARFHTQRHLIGNRYAVAFQRDNFLRMIRQHANILQPQINQNLCANPAFVLHHALPRGFAIKLPARVHMNLRQYPRLGRLLNAKPATRVMQVQKYATILFRNRIQRKRNQLRAVASNRSKDIAR